MEGTNPRWHDRGHSGRAAGGTIANVCGRQGGEMAGRKRRRWVPGVWRVCHVVDGDCGRQIRWAVGVGDGGGDIMEGDTERTHVMHPSLAL